MLKHIRLFVILIIITGFSSCSKKPLHTSQVLESAEERPEPGTAAWIDRLQYDGQYNMSYGYFNNDQNLVIRSMVNDPATVMKIFATGFIVRIDTNGKKDPQFLIKYPLPQGMQNLRENMDQQLHAPGEKPGDRMRQRFLTALNRIELEGFSENAVNNTTLNSRTGGGITAWIHLDSASTMYYELKIPLKEIYGNKYPTTNPVLSIGFESGALDAPGGRPASQMRRSVAGRPGGGMYPGGAMTGSQADRQQRFARMQTLFRPINIWIKRIELQ